jgi:hypothetical protein
MNIAGSGFSNATASQVPGRSNLLLLNSSGGNPTSTKFLISSDNGFKDFCVTLLSYESAEYAHSG